MTGSLRVTLLVGAILLLVHALLRAGFLAANAAYFAGIPAVEIAGAFLYGLRFDVAALVLLNAPAMVIYNLPLPLRKPRWVLGAAFALFLAGNAGGVLLNVVDFGYYPMVQRRSTFEPLERPGDLLHWFPSWLETYPAAVLGGLATLALLTALLGWAARRIHRGQPGAGGAVRSHVCGFVLLGACVLGVRGGLQDGILRPADAFVHSTHLAVGDLTLNSAYTVIVSGVLPRIEPIRSMPEAEAFRLAAQMAFGPGERPVDPRYPFLRQRRTDGPPRPRHVVVFIMESWTYANIGPDAAGVSRTPFFDGLARDGALYTNFLATGQRSSEAVPSIVASLPSLFGRPLIGSQAEFVNLSGLGDLLAPFGYEASFHHGASRTIEGFDGFTHLVGFGDYISREDYEGDEPEEEARDGQWGIYDDLFYLDAARRLDARDGLFAAVVFGLSPHDPYHVPPRLAARFAPFAHETPYQIGLRFSDHALQAFFEHARTRPWFGDTVFVLTGDHTRFAPPGSLYEAFHVPLLLYAPGLVAPGRHDGIGSHTDILPTLLDLLRLPVRHASMGRSLLDPTGPHYAVVQRADRYAIFGERFALLDDLHHHASLHAYREDARFQRDLAGAHPAEAAALRQRLRAWLQACTTAIAEDRVVPP